MSAATLKTPAFAPHAVRPMVIEAMKRYDSLTPFVFNVDAFSWVVKETYGLKALPKAGWCNEVLGKLPYVAKVSGYRLWKYVGDPVPAAHDDHDLPSWMAK